MAPTTDIHHFGAMNHFFFHHLAHWVATNIRTGANRFISWRRPISFLQPLWSFSRSIARFTESPDVHQDLCFRLTAVTIGPDGI
jgi:hypothetical protein